MEYRGYIARVAFDSDAGALFGEVEGLRDVVTFEATNVSDLETAFRDSVDDYLEMCAERGEEAERPYSGKFLVRADPRLHRELAQAAARAGMSLNAYAAEALKSWVEHERVSEPRVEYQSPMGSGRVEPVIASMIENTSALVLAGSTEPAAAFAGSTTPASVRTPSRQPPPNRDNYAGRAATGPGPRNGSKAELAAA